MKPNPPQHATSQSAAAALPGAVPSIAARPSGLNNAVITVRHTRVSLAALGWLVPLQVVMVGVGSIIAMLVTAYLVRGRRRQLWTLGINYGLPAIEMFVAGRVLTVVVDHAHFGDADTGVIARFAVGDVTTAMTQASYLLAVTALAAVGSWALGRAWHDRRQRAVTGESSAG